MSNIRNRTRVVYFRLSEEEFQRFRELCQRLGARNMSDLARSAMELMFQEKAGESFEREVTERLQQMETCLRQIRAAMEVEQL